jgi:hypothetical protein
MLATNLKEAYRVCNIAPSVMQSEELRQYYVDLSASRKTNAINGISLILEDLESIIYTVPISVVYSPKNVNNTFENYHIIPMINIYQYDVTDSSGKKLDYDDQGLDAIASLVEKRIDVNAVFESRDGLIELAKASGGHVRQMMQMVRKAIENARTARKAKVTAEDVIYAINQEQFNFERIIPTEHYPILVQVYLNKNAPKNEIGQLMLTNISALEYNGTSRWNYPNPVVIRSHIFQRALEDYLRQNP